jgi:hypothetical protein
MALNTCTNAQLQCTMGAAPTPFLPTMKMVSTSYMVAANIMDNVPYMNIVPFVTCKSPANPVTASLTAAALGVLTPGPCLPVFPGPWAPGSPTVKLCNQPALNDSSKLACAYAGTVSFNNAGQTSHKIP